MGFFGGHGRVNRNTLSERAATAPRNVARKLGTGKESTLRYFPHCRQLAKMLAMKHQLDRRSFIIASGLTALASTRVLGANDTLRVGVIGAGGRMNGLLDAADKTA